MQIRKKKLNPLKIFFNERFKEYYKTALCYADESL